MPTKDQSARALFAAIVFQLCLSVPALAVADSVVPPGTDISVAPKAFDFSSVPAYSGENWSPGGSDTSLAPAPSGPVTISRDLTQLPQPVRELRSKIIAAARSGDVSELGPIFALQPQPTALGQSQGSDPVVYLKQSSNDGKGCETLAIMLDLLDAPYAVYDKGKPDAVYVWPAFVAEDLNTLTPRDLVDVYRVVSSQDLIDMQQYGGWFFYRLGISAAGQWLFFSAGD